jgi:hypothetical protein
MTERYHARHTASHSAVVDWDGSAGYREVIAECGVPAYADRIAQALNDRDRFEKALENIAEETGTPYARIAQKALDG